MPEEMNTNEAIRDKVSQRYAQIVEDSSSTCREETESAQ